MDKFVLLVGVLVVVGIGYFALNAGPREVRETPPVTNQNADQQNGTDEMENMNMQDLGVLPEDLAGLHIMANGDVMLGDGTVLPDAIIRTNGDVELSDGRVVTPIMDLR